MKRSLALALALVACKPATERVAGQYRSTWGQCTVEVQNNDAVISYPRGAMHCQIEKETLFRCGWQSGDARGKATFTSQSDQTLRGTWGHGDSDSDGGAWVMAR